MMNILAERPILSASAGVGGLGVSTIEALTPPLQFIVLLGSAIIVILTVIIKFSEAKARVKEWFRG